MKKKSEEKAALPKHPEGKGLILLSLCLILLLSLISFRMDDIHHNYLGVVGWAVGFALAWVMGLMSYALIAFLGWLGWQYLLNRPLSALTSKWVYFGCFAFSSCLLLNLCAEQGLFGAWCEQKVYAESILFELPYLRRVTRYNLGGVPLYFLYKDLPTLNLQHMLSNFGVGLTFSISTLVSFLLLTKMQLIPLFRRLKKHLVKKEVIEKVAPESLENFEKALANPAPIYLQPKEKKEISIRTLQEREVPAIATPKTAKSKREGAIEAQKIVNGDFTAYQLPPPSLLNQPKKVDHPSLKKDLKKQAEILEETLLSFGIEAKVGQINCGPTITAFEVHPAVGVKVQKIKTLENDIALNLQAKSIRIIAPIPGKAAVGVEIPSLYPQEVSFKELLLHYQQMPRKMMIPLLLGKAVLGDNVLCDLSRMPHCLIAGATGSGKSVCINTIIMSILMNARPDEIKLLMIDPKKVELTAYAHLPHMIAPVITEPHGAYSALNWLVKEMQLRYEILKQLGVRNIQAFNNRQIKPDVEAHLSMPIPARMHAIVAIIDEFADLMMASSSDLETPIARIAQMARAVGIHLILATQRPSREVITGLIKANFPTRIAFKVSSRVNSQIILDDTGADSLLGNGDMLFLPPGTSSLVRAQGAYISDEEIQRIVSFICDQAPPKYLIESFDQQRFDDPTAENGGAKDSLYDQAFSIVIETQTASTTFLQRKLKIGYARAASLMDELENKGVIAAQEGAKPRRILQQPPNKGAYGQREETLLD